MAQDLQLLADAGERATRCFVLCAQTLIAQPEEIARDWTMIHGTTPHSWLASHDGTRVYDTFLAAYFPADEYLRHFGCIEEKRYTLLEAARLLASSGEYGPWHK